MLTEGNETTLDTLTPTPTQPSGGTPAQPGETTPAEPGETPLRADRLDDQSSRRIGPYRIEHPIARGGMGCVYLAVREDDYEQKVALKLVDRRLQSLDVLERFLEERQFLARLEHPNIARILDGGTTDDGLPFFVMEYIDGEPIDRYCDRRCSSLGERLELFQQICHALHFAHGRLIVHLDLKPGNILVTADGVPKLLDFGIAKLVTEEGSPLEERSPMTPAYASPEQIAGDPVSTASDVYSLGVLLYRLVAGVHPYRTRGTEALEGRTWLEAACTLDPPPPSTVAVETTAHPIPRQRLEGDIDAIVLKAMSKEPEGRYTSSAQLADDLSRHVNDLPIQAHPGTLRQRLRKRVRRNRLELAVFLAVLVFALTVSALWRRAVWQELEAREARVIAETAQARSEVDRLRTQRVSDFLIGLFRSADPDAGELSVREILDRGRQEIADGLEDEPEIRAEILANLGTVYNNLSLYEEARELKEQAVRDRRRVDPPDHAALAGDLNNLGRLYYDLGDYQIAERYYEDAITIWRRLDHEDLGVGLINLAKLRGQMGRVEDAMSLYTEILDRRDTLDQDRLKLAESLYGFGVLHRTRGQLDSAEQILRQALVVSTQAHGPRNTRTASIRGTLGRVLHDLGRYHESREHLEQTLGVRLELLGDDHVKVATARKNLAALLFDLGEPEAAGEHLQAALEILREKRGAGWILADAESLWGVYLAALGRPAEAEPWLIAAYETIRAAKGVGDIATVTARRRAVDFYLSQGRSSDAAALEAEVVSGARSDDRSK